MRVILVILLLALSTSVFANNIGNTTSSTSMAEGSVYVNSTQVNPLLGGYLSSDTVGKEFSTCANTELRFGVLPYYNEQPRVNQYDDDGWGTMAAVQLHIPISSQEACKDAQKAFTYRLETETIASAIQACIAADKAGYTLDPEIVPWAHYCAGIISYRPPVDPVALAEENRRLKEIVDNHHKRAFKK